MTNKSDAHIQRWLDLPSSVLIGSRGLNVGDDKSDWDIAILKEEIPPEYLTRYEKEDISKYFGVLPLGNAELYRDSTTDLIVFEDPNDLKIMKEVVGELCRCPTYLLKNKLLRVSMFEEALKFKSFR